MAAMDEFNRNRVVQTWSYKLDPPHDPIRNWKSMN